MSISISRDYYASALTHVGRWRDADGVSCHRLDQARVTEMRVFDSFGSLAEFVLCDLRYPYEQGHKFETYGWVPAVYGESVRTFQNGSAARGLWRKGGAEAAELACFVADIDNDNTGQPMLTPEQFAASLGRMGADEPAWFTYTSFSSRPDRPKFRVVIDTSRPLTRAESFGVFAWLNQHVLNEQGDSSIYDEGDFLYGPPNNTSCQAGDGGGTLDVDAILADVAGDLALSEIARRASKPKPAPALPLSPDEMARLTQNRPRRSPDVAGIEDLGSDTSLLSSADRFCLGLGGRACRELAYGERLATDPDGAPAVPDVAALSVAEGHADRRS